MRELTGWCTINEVLEARDIDISREMLRLLVKRASSNGEEWVKKGYNPCRWMINTESLSFIQLLRNLTPILEDNEIPLEDEDEEFVLEDDLDYTPVAMDDEKHRETECEGAHRSTITQFWPELCQWLQKEGVLIFSNVLANEVRWQWQWAELTGNGCESVEAAILAALQARIAEQSKSPFFSFDDCQEEQPPQRSWFKLGLG